ncbi:hypothetical protein B0H13DRAFT_2335263 [Mycena leptocephala]|nr:hypothetical protein B0H13DRAFT_2335263 [Mycena leptocephala]
MSFNVDIVLGALLVGTWANSVLYTVEVIQAAYYYRHFKHDNWKLKVLLVSSAIAIDSVSMIANYASVYLYTITHWEPVLGKSFRSYWKNHNRTHVIEQFDPLYLFATGVVAALAQSFLAARYWLLTKNKFITLTLFFFITVANVAHHRSRDGHFNCVGSPVGIQENQVLVQGDQETSGPNHPDRNRWGDHSVAVLVAFLANKESNVPTGIAYGLGPAYCITMLANLNSRKTGKMWPGRGTSSGANPETRGERRNQERSEGGDEYGGIHVHRSAVVLDFQVLNRSVADLAS